MPLEADKKGGFKFPIGDVIPTGLFPTSFSHKIPLWKTGSNVLFTKQGIEKEAGWSLITATGNSSTIRGILQNAEAGGTEAIIYAGDLTKIFRVNAGDASLTEVGTGYSLVDDSGAASWDSGAASWDSGSSLWDFGIVWASQWSFIPFGEWALATYGAMPQIRKGAGKFVDMHRGVTGIFVSNPGTGYVVNDVITCVGGSGSGALARVEAVNGTGGVTKIGMTTSGTGYTTAPTSVSGGSGGSSGLTCTFTICDIDVTTVDIFMNSGPHILGFNTSTSPKEFIWCDADDPDTWVAAPDNLAGQLEIRELQSPIRAVAPLGPRFAVYGDDQMFLVSYLANDLVFGYQPAVNGIGAVSKNSVVSIGRQNLGLSQEGFFMTDGSQAEYIDEPAIRDYFNTTANKSQLSKAFGVHDEANTQVKWFFPTTTPDVEGGVSFNYKTGAWSILSAAFSAGDERRVTTGPILGTNTGVLYKGNTGVNAGSSAMTAWARSKPLDLENADILKELTSIRIGFTGSGLTYRIGWSDTEDGTINWGSYAEMVTGFPFHNLRTAGRWLHFEVLSDTLGAEWSISNIVFIGRTEGER